MTWRILGGVGPHPAAPLWRASRAGVRQLHGALPQAERPWQTPPALIPSDLGFAVTAPELPPSLELPVLPRQPTASPALSHLPLDRHRCPEGRTGSGEDPSVPGTQRSRWEGMRGSLCSIPQLRAGVAFSFGVRSRCLVPRSLNASRPTHIRDQPASADGEDHTAQAHDS